MLRRTPMKRTRKKPVPAAVKAYWDSLPDACALTGAPGTVIHHILADAPGKAGRRDHMLVVRLHPMTHNMSADSVHGLGSEAKFAEVWGVDLVAIAVRNRDEWLAAQATGYWISQQEVAK